MRIDHQIIEEWVGEGSRVLDLGCGDGTLLKILMDKKSIRGYGLDIDPQNILTCVEKGVNVVEQNIDDGLSNFDQQSFDTVIMSQTIQTMRNPKKALEEMLHIGKECIVAFPNFGHWRARFHLVTKGRMPVSDFLSYQWYDTPNIHFCTLLDFEVLCKESDIKILNREVVPEHPVDRILQKFHPNLFGQTALYRVSR